MMFTPYRFRPNRLSSCRVWLSGADPNNGALPDNEELIQTIVNKGWGSVTCQQNTGGNQAPYKSDKYNGKGVLQPDGAASQYPVSGFTFGSQFTLFLVATPTLISPAYFFGTNNATGRGPTFISGFTNTVPQNYEFYDNTDRLIIDTSTDGINICEVTQQDGVNIFGYFNGTLSGNITPTVNANGLTLDLLFGSAAGANLIGTDFGDLLIFNTVLSAAERASVRHYLGDFWGISVS